MDNAPGVTHSTLGHEFRTPAHPDVLVALGRATFNFLNIEEPVVAIAHEAGLSTLPVVRAKMAGETERALQGLADTYRASAKGLDVANALDLAVSAFRAAREAIRNELAHAHPFTAGTDADGNYMPGLGYHREGWKSWKEISPGTRPLCRSHAGPPARRSAPRVRTRPGGCGCTSAARAGTSPATPRRPPTRARHTPADH